jgi:acid phosphatase type 7
MKHAVIAALVLASAAAGSAIHLGCQGTDGEPTAPAGVDISKKAKPQGCKFDVAPRPEYLEYGPSQPVTAGDPKIRRIRLGLGGNVAVGAEGHADPSTSMGFAWQTDDGTLASEVHLRRASRG